MAITRTLRATAYAGVKQNEPDRNSSDIRNLWVENWSYIMYGLLKFDLSQIPAEATITSALLKWKMYDSDTPITYVDTNFSTYPSSTFSGNIIMLTAPTTATNMVGWTCGALFYSACTVDVQVSADGYSWTTVFAGVTATYVNDPGQWGGTAGYQVTLSRSVNRFSPQNVRYIRFVSSGASGHMSWQYTAYTYANIPVEEREGGSTLNIRANRATTDWSANTVTYNTKPTFSSVDAPTVNNAFNQPGQYSPEWDVTDHVQDIIDGTYDNYGWLLECTSGSGGVAFYNGTVCAMPESAELVIVYVSPAAASTEEPIGTSDVPATYTDQVSGIGLVTAVQSETDEPMRKLEVQVFDEDENLEWETEVDYNQLSINQFSVETDTTGHTAVSGAVLTRDTNNAFHGSASLKVAVTATDEAGAAQSMTATPGVHYSGQVRLRADSGTPTLRVLLQIKDSGGSVVASKVSTDMTIYSGYNLAVMGMSIPPTNATHKNLAFWQVITIEDVEAPYNAATIEIVVLTAGLQTATWYQDAMIINPDNVIAPWIIDDSIPVVIPASILEYGQTYGWRAKATNTVGESGWTPLEYFQCTMSQEGTPTIEDVPTEGLIRLTLVDHPAENLAGYRLYRRKQGATTWEVHTSLVATSSIDDLIAESGQEYEYCVSAVAVDGYVSTASETVSETLTVDKTFIGTIGLDDLPALTKFSRPFVGQKQAVWGSNKAKVSSQASARDMEMECWVYTRTIFEALEALLNSSENVRYVDPFGRAFYFRVVGDISYEHWPSSDLYGLKVNITEVD